MLKPLFNIEALQEDIEHGSLIITANNRLASKIRQAWALKQSSRQQGCWQQPEVYALETWVDGRWQELCDLGIDAGLAGVPLTPQQELLLWELAIAEDDQRPVQLSLSASARQASQAYRIIQQWLIPESEIATEAPLVYRWTQYFREQLSRHDAITKNDAILSLSQAYQKQQWPRVDKIVLVGFQTLPPLYRQLLQSACNQLVPLNNPASPSEGYKTSLHNEAVEIHAAAAWAKQLRQQKPDARIGVVVPDLTRLRPQVDRLFREQLQPEFWAVESASNPPPFNISAGVPLADTPLIRSALLLLSLNRQALPLSELRQLLNAPFWGTPEDTALKARTEISLQKLAKQELRTSELRFWLFKNEGEQPTDDTPRLSNMLEQFETLHRQAPKKSSLHAWLKLFNLQLQCVNWAGSRSLNSFEYQQLQHWQNLLETALLFDRIKGQISCEDALFQLSQMAASAPFQPETPDEAVQILGVLEASDLRFDYLWVMGMDDRKWPQPCQYNPLLSAQLQRKYQTPRSLPENELQLAQQQLLLFQRNADHIIFSHSQYDGDRELRVSRLLAQIPSIEPEVLLADCDLISNRYGDYAPVALTQVNCSHGPSLEMNASPITGGSGIFDAQAACPFNAFAKYRLGATQPDAPSLGLSAMERGNILHHVMEALWQQLGDHATLMQTSEIALEQLLADCIDAALQPLQKTHRELMTPAFAALEKKRLLQLIGVWLEVEKSRSPFTVTAHEKTQQVNFADLSFTLRIDRIDTSDDGQQMIIDYKTGKTNIKSWFGDRPSQPQLPLYAICSDTPPAAISFATLNVDQVGFSGVGENPNLLPQLTAADAYEGCENWVQLQEQWREKLGQLASEFKTGCADVTFYNPKAKEWQSELLPLNRWYGYEEEDASQ